MGTPGILVYSYTYDSVIGNEYCVSIRMLEFRDFSLLQNLFG